MQTCLVTASEQEIAKMQNLDDVYRYLERHDQMVGGGNLEEIVSLSEAILGKKRFPVFIKKFSDDAQFYLFDSELCQQIAAAEHEQLLNLSVIWSQTDCWRNKNHNAMDLAGFLLDLAMLCKRAIKDKNSLYVVVESK